MGGIRRILTRSTQKADFIGQRSSLLDRLAARRYPANQLRRWKRESLKWDDRPALVAGIIAKYQARKRVPAPEDSDTHKPITVCCTFDHALNSKRLLRDMLLRHWHLLSAHMQGRQPQVVDSVKPNLYRTTLCMPAATRKRRRIDKRYKSLLVAKPTGTKILVATQQPAENGTNRSHVRAREEQFSTSKVRPKALPLIPKRAAQ